MTEKERAIELIESLPDTASTDDIMYELYVKRILDRSLAQAAAGQTIPHEQVEKEMAKWLKK